MAYNLLQKPHRVSVSGIHIKVKGRNPLLCLLHAHSSMSLPIMPTHAFTCMYMYMHTRIYIWKSNCKENSLYASEETSENLFWWLSHVGAVVRLSVSPGPLTGLTNTFLQYFSLHHRWVECVPFQSSHHISNMFSWVVYACHPIFVCTLVLSKSSVHTQYLPHLRLPCCIYFRVCWQVHCPFY